MVGIFLGLLISAFIFVHIWLYFMLVESNKEGIELDKQWDAWHREIDLFNEDVNSFNEDVNSFNKSKDNLSNKIKKRFI